MSTFNTEAIEALLEAVVGKAVDANQAEGIAASSRTTATSAIEKYNRDLGDFVRKRGETLDEIERAIDELENMREAVVAVAVPEPIVNPDAGKTPPVVVDASAAVAATTTTKRKSRRVR